ncbi:hypothetical protein K493DRAFT_320001 [Basidiobolus meristosporus CBS 931.73]|uniref:Protein Zds1 C-terminal domain-containing protein n=1 Tax=Basidiobolus meristosporus CBS 931.73 TaxID=1314790 RepID=A0A1Y1XHQ5_9FUNG|nr:hypothetical protein K493DRAFT_320001 [Basidiobolus meristosporus CBS 931.73]|eukprot:ORX85222.1 hypothetical protein K493DRAFT_320001 [Basidiobolus meristosporus CBS 931.73]
MVNSSSHSTSIEADTLNQSTPTNSMVVLDSTHDHPHLFDHLADNEVPLPETKHVSRQPAVEMESTSPGSLSEWALSENPSHLFWVPAHLHPEIAPHQFKTWLMKHSSAVNQSETTLSRRKSILSLHSYSGADFANEPTAGEKPSAKPPLNPSGLKRQLTVTTGMKIPTSQDKAGNGKPVFNPPFLIQSADLRPSLKRSARTKVRRNSVKSTESRINATIPTLRKSKSVEGGLSQTKKINLDKAGDTSEESGPLAGEPEECADEQNEEKDSLEERSASKHPPPRKDSLPALPNLDTLPPVKTPETLEKSTPGIPKKKGSSWSWLWGNEPNDVTAPKAPKSKKADKSRSPSPEELLGNSEDAKNDEERAEGVTKKKPSKKKKQASPDAEIALPQELNQPIADQKIKKPYSPILTFFSKSKSKASLTPQGSETPAPNENATKPDMSPAKPRYTNYSRLPIHIERAIYRLSHIKLTNPRRPLFHQVLISNLMFWYLSIVSKQSSDPAGAEDRTTKEAKIVKSKVGKTGGGRRRSKRSPPDNPDGMGNGKRSEMLVKSPQYRKQHQHIHNGGMGVMLKSQAEATRHHLAKSHSAYSDSSSDTDSDTSYDSLSRGDEDDNDGGDGDGDDDDDLPLAIYRGNLTSAS